MTDDTIPRLSIDLRKDQREALDRYIPWGMGRAMWHVIIDDVIALSKEHGALFVSLMVTERVAPREVMPSLAQADAEVRKARKENGDD